MSLGVSMVLGMYPMHFDLHPVSPVLLLPAQSANSCLMSAMMGLKGHYNVRNVLEGRSLLWLSVQGVVQLLTLLVLRRTLSLVLRIPSSLKVTECPRS